MKQPIRQRCSQGRSLNSLSDRGNYAPGWKTWSPKNCLGHAGGLDAEVTESRLQDRYLVWMLTPKNRLIRAAEMDVQADDSEGSIEVGATIRLQSIWDLAID